MAGLFWSVATSYAVLSILATLFLSGLVVGFAPLVRFIPGLAPYVMLARLVALIALAVLSFLIGFRVADERAEVERLKADLAFKQKQIDVQKHTAETAERLRLVAETKAEQANQKVTDYEERLAKLPTSGCYNLDDDDVRGLLDIAH